MKNILKIFLVVVVTISLYGCMEASPGSHIKFQNLITSNGIGQDILNGIRYGNTYYGKVEYNTETYYEDWVPGIYYLEFLNGYGEWVVVSGTSFGYLEEGNYTLRMSGDSEDSTVTYDLIKN